MAAYNVADYIKDSIESILNQTFTNFELLIVDDGSTDQTVEIIKQYTDQRIRLVQNGTNKGVTYTRNIALTEARGEFIAVLDSDDIAVENRLELQYNFFSKHPEIALCGGDAIIIDQNGMPTGERIDEPTGAENLKITLLFTNTYVNSTVMYKTSVLRELKGYRDYAPAEDYDLFTRIADVYAVDNIKEVLVKYRKHESNISSRQSANGALNVKRIKENQLASLGITPNKHLTDIHYSLLIYDYSHFTFQEYLNLFTQLKEANRKVNKYPLNTFEKMLFHRWFEIIYLKKAKMNALTLLFDKRIYNATYSTNSQIRKAFRLSLKGLGKISK